MKYLLFCSAIALLSLFMVSCKGTKKNKNKAEFKNENNNINLYVNGKLRLQGVQPRFEGTDFKADRTELSGNLMYFNKGEKKVLVEAVQQNGVIIFTLSPNQSHSHKGNDFVGLFAESIPDFQIGTASYKYGSVKAWTHPVQIKSISDLNEKDNQFFLWKYKDGLYAAAMPLGGKGYMAQLGRNNNAFGAKAYSYVDDTDSSQIPVIAIAFGTNPYKTIENLYAEGMKYMGKEAGLRKNKPYPEFYNKLMWCTWNSFGHSLDEKKVFTAMDEFKKVGMNFPLILLDDGWSTVSKYGTGKLQSFEPDKTKFPAGFKSVVDRLKTDYGVKEVGVWHAFNGYWAGLDPDSELGKRYKADLLPYQDKVAWSDAPIDTFWIANPMKKAGFQFYDDWYSYLKSEGISFLKVDNQLIADRVARNNYPFSTLAEAMQSNLQSAVKKHFGGNVLNCMDMTTDAVYNYGSSPLARSSEDFFPESDTYKISGGNAAIHVLCNVYNSLWWGQMVWPDFDMFQTHHPNAEYHAIARAISGGPIYFADSVGKSKPDILKKLTLADGTILKADQPAVPTEDCLFDVTDAKPLKVFSISNGTGLLGIFNAADADKVEGFFKPTDINGLKGRNYAVYDYLSKTVRKAGADEQLPISLPRLGYQLYFVKPIVQKFASFGLIEKYNAPKTIKKEVLQDKMVLIELFESGTFAAYTEKTPLKVITENEKPLEYSLKDGLLLVKVPEGSTKVAIQF